MFLRAPAVAAVLFLATSHTFAQDSATPSFPTPATGVLAAPELAVPQVGADSLDFLASTPEADASIGRAIPASTESLTATNDSALPSVSNTSAPSVDTVSSSDRQQTGTDASIVNISSTEVIAEETAVLVEPKNSEIGPIAMAEEAWDTAYSFLKNGGPSIWAIAGLAVITLALILWKIWRLALVGAWSRGKAGKAVDAFELGDAGVALSIVNGRIGVRSKVVTAALKSIRDLPEDRAREETARVAKHHLAQASVGLGALELIATIAPLLGLLGTVLGMIAAFQALQEAGSKADPALLAGGIWEALLTTAAGMAVAIPASAALTWFEAVINRIRRDVEDSSTRIFVAQQPNQLSMAAE